MGSMKTALVRGASSGMGRETTKRLVEMSEEFLGRRAALDDDAFDTWLSENTGLAGLKV